ncbi:hypothetical protein FQA39_LY02545 [Lamprigera yunnana]|nr:hypothetical protein FQA39_LY02545 [Lamprigera yunnana]
MTFNRTCQCIIIDTKITGLREKDEIVQIAVLGNSGVQFKAFMIPTVSFEPRGSAKTGLSMDNGRLLRHGIELPLPTVSSLEAPNAFISFLKSLSCQILLVGHNIVRFDAPKICKWLRQHKLEGEFYEMLYGFLKEKAVSIKNYCKNRALIAIQHRNRPSLEPLNTIISTAILNKMVRNGITLNELKRELQQFGTILFVFLLLTTNTLRFHFMPKQFLSSAYYRIIMWVNVKKIMEDEIKILTSNAKLSNYYNEEVAKEMNLNYVPCRVTLQGFGQRKYEGIRKRTLVVVLEDVKLEVDMSLVPNKAQDNNMIVRRNAIKENNKLTAAGLSTKISVLERKRTQTAKTQN